MVARAPAAQSNGRPMTHAIRIPLLFSFIALGLAGCDPTAEGDKPASKAADKSGTTDAKDAKGGTADAKGGTADAQTPTKDPKQLFTGKAPELPGPLAKLSFGMTAEEITKAAPELEDGYASAKEYADTWFGYYVPEERKTMTSVRVVVETEGFELEKVLTAAWGEPKRGTYLEHAKLFWFNPEKEIRATVSMGYGKEKEVEFERYLPAARLLGEGKDRLGIETTPLLGATYEDLTKNYGQWLEILTKEQAERQRAQIEAMTGKKLDILGDAVPSTNIDLLPTEYGNSFTRVSPTLEGGKIVRLRLGIDYEQFPPAKDEILALLKAKWGEPTEQEKYGRKQWLFNAAPKVIVEDNETSGAWDVEISP